METLCTCGIYRFYYDFFVPGEPLSDSNLKEIKKEMDKIIKMNFAISRREVTRSEVQ